MESAFSNLPPWAYVVILFFLFVVLKPLSSWFVSDIRTGIKEMRDGQETIKESINKLKDSLRDGMELRVKQAEDKAGRELREVEHDLDKKIDRVLVKASDNEAAIARLIGNIQLFRPSEKIDQQMADTRQLIADSIEKLTKSINETFEHMLMRSLKPIDDRLTRVEGKVDAVNVKVTP